MSSKLAKEITQIFLALFIAILLCSAPAYCATIRTGQKQVVIDAGHGGKDKGLNTPIGIQEQQITVELAQLIANELNDTFRVLLTRPPGETDLPDSKSHEDRAAFANQNRADLFVSLHLHQRRHKESYIFILELPPAPALENRQPQIISTAPQSKKIAALAANHLQKLPDLKVLVRQAQAIALEGLLMPGILVEPFSISQIPTKSSDRADFLTGYARVLAQAIRDYFKTASTA